MDRDEILTKSRMENTLKDERAKYIELKGANFSMTVLVILWILLSNLVPLEEAGRYSIGLLVTATSFSNLAYQLMENKTKSIIFFTSLFLIAAIIYLFFLLRVVL